MKSRYRLVLFAAIAVTVLVGASAAVVVSRKDPERARFERIREGMTQDELIAVMGRPPDTWAGATALDWTDWPLPPDAYVTALEWQVGPPDVGPVIIVELQEDGRATHKRWLVGGVPLWDRIRDWLHL